MQTYVEKRKWNLKIYVGQAWCRARKKLQKIINVGHFNKAVGPRKTPNLINVGPTSIPESRVMSLQ